MCMTKGGVNSRQRQGVVNRICINRTRSAQAGTSTSLPLGICPSPVAVFPSTDE